MWVTCEGRDELTKLTLAILDYATHDPPVQLTKDVQFNIDEYGLPTLGNDSMGTVKATIGITERPESLLSIPEPDAVRIEQLLQQRLKDLEGQLKGANPAESASIVTEMNAIRRAALPGRAAAGGAAQAAVLPQFQQCDGALLRHSATSTGDQRANPAAAANAVAEAARCGELNVAGAMCANTAPAICRSPTVRP